ncbi:MAG: hypothetical protein O3A47_09595 [Chloroflexi bacterium]|nr:hypothetical protein [Chloroflexota bacterium]
MSWWVITVRLPPVEAHIHADRRLAFEFLTAFGANQGDEGASRVIEDRGDRKLVEFHSSTPTLTGKRKTYRTVEWVTLEAPTEILFEGVEGPLSLLRDRFTLEDLQGCTRFLYESTVGVPGWVLGWLVAQTYVRTLLGKFMREHTASMKEKIEDRARKSRVYPYKDCGVDSINEDRGR